ncbi:MAG: tetratricopeptide repeat protein [Anaerolineae bacterium]|nr:tetratricopeptide repeat protein [Anaerolineae bacterium]
MQIEKTVFISYRRANIYTARAVYRDLTAHGYDVFMSPNEAVTRRFEPVMLNQIAARAHFIVVFTPSAIAECRGLNHWIRQEIEYALEMKRHIVPLLFDWFTFQNMRHCLADKLATLPEYTALEIQPTHFQDGLERLRHHFLSNPPDVTIHPMPPGDESIVQQIQEDEIRQPAVSAEQLAAEQHFEQAHYRYIADNAGMIAQLSAAIRLNPHYTEAYAVRGMLRSISGDIDIEDAISDFDAAIRLDPQYAYAYRSRGNCRRSTGDYDGAIADYNEAIRLNPDDAENFINRGVAYQKKGDLRQANADYQRYIDNGGREADKVRGWIRKNEAELRKRGG